MRLFNRFSRPPAAVLHTFLTAVELASTVFFYQ